MDCNRPYGPMIFGPSPSCIQPKIFCSIIVRDAMARRMGITRIKILIVNIVLGREFEPLVIKVFSCSYQTLPPQQTLILGNVLYVLTKLRLYH